MIISHPLFSTLSMKMTECSFQQNEVGEAFWINKDKRTFLSLFLGVFFFCGTLNSFSDLKKKKEPPTLPPQEGTAGKSNFLQNAEWRQQKKRGFVNEKEKDWEKKKSVKKIIWVPEYYVAHRILKKQKKRLGNIVCDVMDILSVWFLDDFSHLSSDSSLFFFPSTPHEGAIKDTTDTGGGKRGEFVLLCRHGCNNWILEKGQTTSYGFSKSKWLPRVDGQRA